MADNRRILRDEMPFDFNKIKDGKYQIFFKGRLIQVLHGRDAVKFSRIADRGDEYEIQLFLAKATGHFKHGNER